MTIELYSLYFFIVTAPLVVCYLCKRSTQTKQPLLISIIKPENKQKKYCYFFTKKAQAEVYFSAFQRNNCSIISALFSHLKTPTKTKRIWKFLKGESPSIIPMRTNYKNGSKEKSMYIFSISMHSKYIDSS